MSINTSWKVEIGLIASKTNFTSRVMSMSIDQSVDVNVVGRGQCTITLLNKDGALTPGGGGTYTSADWFAMGVFVTALTNTGGADTETAVFHGVVTDFQLVDDGVFSTVTITALDGLSVIGKTPSANFSFSTNYWTVYSGFLIGFATIQPLLGQFSASAFLSAEGTGSGPLVSGTATAPTYADYLQTYLVPSVNDVTWSTTIYLNLSTTTYKVISLGPNITRNTANTVDFEFDPPASLSGSKLPFSIDGFTQKFNNDDLIIQAQVKGIDAGLTTQTSTASTVTNYGNRTVGYTSTVAPSDAAALSLATNLTNRYGNIAFTPATLEITANQIKAFAANAAHSKWYNLLSIETGLWQKCKITWTGSGAASQTKYSIIKGRSINVTPDNTYVSLRLADWVNNHSFILNTDLLDQDRLG